MTADVQTRPFNHFYQSAPPSGEYRMFQVCWIVDDMIPACQKWSKVYGIGPFHVLPKRTGKVRYRGQESEFEMQVAIAQSGPVQIELICQTGDTPSIYREIYPQGKGGIHHMCTVTRQFDATAAHYESLGYPLVAEVVGPMRVAYFDTFADFGFITELVEPTPEFMGHITQIAETCANWDGKDPVRLLKRGGYRVPEEG